MPSNITHTLNVGNKNYPIYGEGVQTNTLSSASYPYSLLVGSSKLNLLHSMANYQDTIDIYTSTMPHVFYKSSVTLPENEFSRNLNVGTILLPRTVESGTIANGPHTGTSASADCLTGNEKVITNNNSENNFTDSFVIVTNDVIPNGSCYVLPAITFNLGVYCAGTGGKQSAKTYAYSPLEYRIGDCYARVEIINRSTNEVLKYANVSLSGKYRNPEAVELYPQLSDLNITPSRLSNTQFYKGFSKDFFIPQIKYTNNSNEDIPIIVRLIPFYYASALSGIPLDLGYLYSRNYSLIVGTDVLNNGSSIIPNGAGAQGSILPGIILYERYTYKYLAIKYSVSIQNRPYFMRRKLGSGLDFTSNYTQDKTTPEGQNNICLTDSGIAIGRHQPSKSISFLTPNSFTVYNNNINRISMSVSNDGALLSTSDAYDISLNYPNFFICTAGDCVLQQSTGMANNINCVPYENKEFSIGNTSNMWKSVYGVNFYINGVQHTTSDERYKDFIEDIDVDFNKLKSIPKKKFTWKEGRFFDDYKVHLGTSAQKVKEIYPELVNIYNSDECNDINDEKAILGVDYEKLSLVALAAIDKIDNELADIDKEFNKIKNNIVKNNNILLKLNNI